MFRLFRLRATRPEIRPPTTDAAESQDLLAWADYVEWSGLDEGGLPNAEPHDDPDPPAVVAGQPDRTPTSPDSRPTCAGETGTLAGSLAHTPSPSAATSSS